MQASSSGAPELPTRGEKKNNLSWSSHRSHTSRPWWRRHCGNVLSGVLWVQETSESLTVPIPASVVGGVTGQSPMHESDARRRGQCDSAHCVGAKSRYVPIFSSITVRNSRERVQERWATNWPNFVFMRQLIPRQAHYFSNVHVYLGRHHTYSLDPFSFWNIPPRSRLMTDGGICGARSPNSPARSEWTLHGCRTWCPWEKRSMVITSETQHCYHIGTVARLRR